MQPAPQQAPSGGGLAGDRERRNDLSSWWKTFKQRGAPKKEDDQREAAGSAQAPVNIAESQGIFGVPLQQSVRYANVAISLSDGNGQSYIYGYVPIVVAKCGVFLKEKATDVEGIFRLSGSEKRIKELRNAFNSPDRYGKGLDWTGYTVHDAANILRRYFNQLPEPIIPLEFYDKFRDPLRGHQSQAVGQRDEKSLQPSSNFDQAAVIETYQHLITQLPPLNRQLLLYILDLLAVFASKSDLNKMTTANLAAIFQPGILRHPAHDMAVSEYHLSQDVLIFLIENQDHFLIGMQGTEADEKTVQEVESGPPTPANLSTLVRSGSNSSRNGGTAPGVRRSVSASSRKSRGSSGAPSPAIPVVPGVVVPIVIGTGGVYRSNTLPPRSPSATIGRFSGTTATTTRNAEPPTPEGAATTGLNTTTVGDTSLSHPRKENVPIISSQSLSKGKPADGNPQKRPHSQAVLHEVMSPNESMPILPDALATSQQTRESPQVPDSLFIPTSPNVNNGNSADQTTPTANKGPGAALAALFGGKSPGAGSLNDEVGTGSYIGAGGAGDIKKKPNKLQKKPKDKAVGGINASAHSSTGSLSEAAVNLTAGGASMATSNPEGYMSTSFPNAVGGEYLAPIPPMGSSIKLTGSPAMASVSATSDVEEGGDILGSSVDQHGKRGRWFRRHQDQPSNSLGLGVAMGSNSQAAVSRSSVLSSEGRKSTALERGVTSDSEQETGALGSSIGGNRLDPLSWMKGKINKLRVASPTRETYPQNTGNIDEIGIAEKEHEQQHNLMPGLVEPYIPGSGLAQMVRGRSFDVPGRPPPVERVEEKEDKT